MSGPPRRFDWDEANRLRKLGWSYAAIARELGVTAGAIKRATDPEYLRRDIERSTKWLKNGTCPVCGGPSTRIAKNKNFRCNTCAAKARAKVVDGQAYCFKCERWKPLDDFSPRKGLGRPVHGECRSCDTARRRANRAANREREQATARARRRRKREAQELLA